jgi:hypothetical protein
MLASFTDFQKHLAEEVNNNNPNKLISRNGTTPHKGKICFALY